jgi:hypothetical protein
MPETNYRALCVELLQFGDQAGEIAANEGLWPDCDPGPDSLLDRARAALAQPELEVAGLSDDAIEADFRSWYNERYHHHYFGAIPLVECIEWTRYALTRYGTRPQPVPVAERPWEREGWCDAQGICWWWHAATDDTNPGWIPATYADIELVGVEFFDSSLPHHALPVPGAEVG